MVIDRRLMVVGLAFAALAAVLLALTWPSAAGVISPTMTLIWIAAVAAADLWSYRFSPKVHWSYGSTVMAAPLILSAPGTAPLLGAILGSIGAVTDSELTRPDLSRILANAGQLTIAGCVTGLVYELLRPASVEPSAELIFVVALAFAANVVVNALAVAIGATYAYGSAAAQGLAIAIWLLGWRKFVASVATASIAATVAVIGPAWILFALVQIGALGAIPIVRSRLEARRRDIMQAVASALNARGVVGSAHDRLEETALTLGHRLGLTADQIEQLRYVSLLYSMTDQFATSLPRSFEDQLRGLRENAFSSALLLGLPLNDVADSRVVRIADAAAQYEALVNPVEGEDPLSPNEAAAELLRSGTSPNLIAALLAEKPLSDSYLRAWEIDPGSPWQRPMRWLTERAS